MTMADLMQAARLAVKLESHRDRIRQLWGEDYDRRMDRLVGALGQIAVAKGETPFKLAMAEASAATDGVVKIQMLAAAVEIAEGREGTPYRVEE